MDSHDVPPELDPATHLASRKEAEKAIQAAVAAGGGKSLLIAVVKRVQAVNARFGYAAGDRMLAAAAEHFRSSLSPADQLFRWHGPSILAILSSADRVDLLRARIHRFADAKLEKGVDLGNRTVLIPVSTNWSLLAAAPPVDALLKKIDAFTAAQISRDYA